MHHFLLCKSHYFQQLIVEMQRLVDDDHLRTSSARTWKDLTVKVLCQAKLEYVHNSRLRISMYQYGINKEGKHDYIVCSGGSRVLEPPWWK